MLCVCNVASSAKKSEKQCFKNRGKSFVKRRNKVGPNIDPWVTPEFTLANSERPASHAIACLRDDKYDWNNPRDGGAKFV